MRTDPLERVRSLEWGEAPTIVLAEGDDERVVEAAERASEEGFCRPLLIRRQSDGPDLPTIVPEEFAELEALEAHLARRLPDLAGEEIQRLALDRLYFSGLLTATGRADGAVMGAVETTAATVRACLRTIGRIDMYPNRHLDGSLRAELGPRPTMLGRERAEPVPNDHSKNRERKAERTGRGASGRADETTAPPGLPIPGEAAKRMNRPYLAYQCRIRSR